MWDLAAAFDLAHQPAPQLPLLLADEQAQLAPMPADERLLRTFAATGVTAGAHLTEIKRDAFAQAGCATFGELQRVRSGELGWTKIDDLHRLILDDILPRFGLAALPEKTGSK